MSVETLVSAFVALLVLASVVAVAVDFLPVPYASALALVGLGLGLALRPQVTHAALPALSPAVILFGLIPGLVFEAAYRLRWAQLRSNLAAVLALATVGVVLTTALVGLMGHFALGLAVPLALLLGTMVAPTDPVSVVSVFRRLGVPAGLTNLIEAESLANDGTGVVAFVIALGAVTAAGAFAPFAALIEFVRLALGGLALGLALGFALSRVTARVDDFLVEISITAVAAYGGYLLGQRLGLSGILTVVGAGLVMGNYGRPRGMSPRSREAVDLFWDYVAFVLNAFVFLAIGLYVPGPSLLHYAGAVIAAAVIALAARAVTVYTLLGPLHLVARGVSLRWQHLMIWGGLRGAIAIALALSLTNAGPQFDELRALVYGVVLITIVVQGVTVGPLARWLLPVRAA
ncbi:MAG: sodium:proton antiporter [Candidatus Dormibacteraeota bacterium]|nr:sodium:proton antiporter [Candidatus Dormibacteraeota bacterium]